MRKLLMLILSCFSCLTAAEPVFPLAPARECSPRKGLPNFLAKAATPGAEIKIGYLGGSITAQAGWRPLTLGYFQKQERANDPNGMMRGVAARMTGQEIAAVSQYIQGLKN